MQDPASMRPLLSVFSQTAPLRKPGCRSETWCWLSMAPRSAAWSTQKLCTWQGKVGGRATDSTVSPRKHRAALHWGLPKWKRQCDFFIWIKSHFCPCSFCINGQPQWWNQKMAVSQMYSIEYQHISLNPLPLLSFFLSLSLLPIFFSFHQLLELKDSEFKFGERRKERKKWRNYNLKLL